MLVKTDNSEAALNGFALTIPFRFNGAGLPAGIWNQARLAVHYSRHASENPNFDQITAELLPEKKVSIVSSSREALFTFNGARVEHCFPLSAIGFEETVIVWKGQSLTTTGIDIGSCPEQRIPDIDKAGDLKPWGARLVDATQAQIAQLAAVRLSLTQSAAFGVQEASVLSVPGGGLGILPWLIPQLPPLAQVAGGLPTPAYLQKPLSYVEIKDLRRPANAVPLFGAGDGIATVINAKGCLAVFAGSFAERGNVIAGMERLCKGAHASSPDLEPFRSVLSRYSAPELHNERIRLGHDNVLDNRYVYELLSVSDLDPRAGQTSPPLL